MNWFVKIALLTVILVAGTAAAMFAGETRGLALTDLSEASVSAVAQPVDGGTLLAAFGGNQKGVFRSDDGGRSWERLSAGPEGDISALAISPMTPDIVFAGTASEFGRNGGNLWYSADGGRTWDGTLFGLPADETGAAPVVSALSAAPGQPNLMYLGTWGRGLYQFDVREGWMERLGGSKLANLYVNDVVALPDKPPYVVATEGLFRIEGNRLAPIATPDGVISLAVHPVKPDTLYIGTVGYGVHRSSDGGQSWQALSNGLGLQPGVILRIPAITIDGENPQHLAISTAFSVGSRLIGDGIFESYDAGQSWTRLAGTDELVSDLTIESDGVYAATSSGLVRYGEPLPAPEPTVAERVQSLTSPTANQLVILMLTLAVGGWVLFARRSWATVQLK